MVKTTKIKISSKVNTVNTHVQRLCHAYFSIGNLSFCKKKDIIFGSMIQEKKQKKIITPKILLFILKTI